jgi:cytochrome d ubiquinol oxidase subunit I
MLALTVCAWWLAWRKRLFTSPLFLRAATLAIPIGYVAVTAGWITTEVGRQPYVVYGHLRTADAVTPFLTTGDVVASLIAYIVVYLVIFGAGATYLVRLVQRGIPKLSEADVPRTDGRAAPPLSAATDATVAR